MEAGLVEKDQEEGRRRVIYRPTSKAEAIIKGRERKVKFSLASSIVSGFTGLALLGGSRLVSLSNMAYTDKSTSLAMDSAAGSSNAGAPVAETAGSLAGLEASAVFLFLGLGFISVSVLGLA